MKKKHWKSSKTVGNEAENIVESWLQESGIKYERENTVRNTRIRNAGSVDFVGENFCIEVKKYTKLLTFKYGSNDHDIHWDQVEHLHKAYLNGKVSGFVITEDCETFVFVHIKEFIQFFIDNTRKSINHEIAVKIGEIITDMRWLNEKIVS